MKSLCSALLLLFASAAVLSQTPDSPPASTAHTSTEDSTPSILPELDRLQTAASQVAQEIGQMHIEKWKTNSAAISAAQANASSVQRNLTSALPGLIAAVRAAPSDVNAEFKLYRNLNALYDVFGTVTDSTRIFGQKSEYESLSQQLQVIGSVRRKLGESLEQQTADTQHELNQMRAQIKEQQAQVAAANAATEAARNEAAMAQAELQKKASQKKKTGTKKPATTASGATTNPSASNAGDPSASASRAPKP